MDCNMNRNSSCNMNRNTNNSMVRNSNCNMSRSSNNNMNRNSNYSMNKSSNCGMNRSTNCNMNRGTNNTMDWNSKKNITRNVDDSCCGMKIFKSDGCDIGNEPIDEMMPSMAFVPWQQWKNVYDMEKGLERGTIFEELDKPYLGRPIK